MFTHDLFSSLPTDDLSAEKAYDAYWAVATSEAIIANSTAPVYRFARDYMIRAVMAEYKLTIAQVAWLYDEVLPEGPGWGSLDRMVQYGREMRFGQVALAQAVANCAGCHDGYHEHDETCFGTFHTIDCPFRTDNHS